MGHVPVQYSTGTVRTVPVQQLLKLHNSITVLFHLFTYYVLLEFYFKYCTLIKCRGERIAISTRQPFAAKKQKGKGLSSESAWELNIQEIVG